MKLSHRVEFKEKITCNKEGVEGVNVCEHKNGGKKKIPCKMCLGRNRRDDNIQEEYPIDEFGRRVKVTSPDDWEGVE